MYICNCVFSSTDVNGLINLLWSLLHSILGSTSYRLYKRLSLDSASTQLTANKRESKLLLSGLVPPISLLPPGNLQAAPRVYREWRWVVGRDSGVGW